MISLIKKSIKKSLVSADSAISAESATGDLKNNEDKMNTKTETISNKLLKTSNMNIDHVVKFTGNQNEMEIASDYLKTLGKTLNPETHFEVNERSIMPPCLDVEFNRNAGVAYKALFCKKILPEWIYIKDAREHILNLPEELQMESLNLALQYRKNILETGYATKEQWSWATGYDYNQPIGDTTIEFNTTWNPGTELVSELSKKFPSTWFEYCYTVDYSTNWKQWVVNGEVLNAVQEELDLDDDDFPF